MAIPPGWKPCDGTAGTPDLRNKFILGAGIGMPVGQTGGSTVHNHDFTADGHNHRTDPGELLEGGNVWDDDSTPASLTGTTDNATMLPEYIALIYVQKI